MRVSYEFQIPKTPLDNSAVHPESYGIVKQMAKDANCTVADLIADKNLRKQNRFEQICDQ